MTFLSGWRAAMTERETTMNLHKIWLIARREYLTNFRRRSFLVTAFVLPLISIGAMTLIFGFFTQNLEDVSDYHSIGIVDKAGIVADSSGGPLPKQFKIIPDEDTANAALKANTIQGYFVIS